MKLFEIVAQPAPYTWDASRGEGYVHIDGRRYIVNAVHSTVWGFDEALNVFDLKDNDENENMWDENFGESQVSATAVDFLLFDSDKGIWRTTITGTGNAIKIFATVHDIIVKHIAPDMDNDSVLWFTADKTGDSRSRKKLYDRFARNMQGIEFEGQREAIYLIKKQNIR